MVICLLIKERYGKYTKMDPCSLNRCPTKFTSGLDEITISDVQTNANLQVIGFGDHGSQLLNSIIDVKSSPPFNYKKS